MKIYVAPDYEEMSRIAADIVAEQITTDPESVLGLATGSTPIGMYRQLSARYAAKKLDFNRIRTVNLDEYAGLKPENEQSYRYFMQKNLFDHINIDPKNTHVPDGTDVSDEACKRYDRLIEDLGGIDIQVLGIGHDGHIGFNEPSDVFEKGTHVTQLDARTIAANSRFFGSNDLVPRFAVTMGIKTIMQAKKILLLVSGKDKAQIIDAALNGPITPKVPASALQLHRNVILVGDKDALSAFGDD